jgi:ribosomal protein S11
LCPPPFLNEVIFPELFLPDEFFNPIIFDLISKVLVKCLLLICIKFRYDGVTGLIFFKFIVVKIILKIMFLSHIIKQTYGNLIKYLMLNKHIKKKYNLVSFLKQVDEKNQTKRFSLKYNYFFPFKPKNLIKYIISINLLEKNTFLNVTDIRGNLKFFRSAGFVELRSKRKIKQPLALNHLIDSLKNEASFLYNKPVALHLTNVNFFSYKYVISKLEIFFFITFIRIFDSKPHNGCRPKKIKRRKK